MKPRGPIYRELKKRGESFLNLPLHLSRRSFLNNLWPFDDSDEVLEPIERCHVGDLTWKREIYKVKSCRGAGEGFGRSWVCGCFWREIQLGSG
ncbi:hypothetical protein Tco_1350660 [Tanacetum coccineum]